MAERRMISKSVVNAMTACELPLTAQALYMHYVVKADDDGFVDAPKALARFCMASEQDIQALHDAGFIIPFESGVIVITHWHAMNHVQPSKYIATKHSSECALLCIDENDVYIESDNGRTFGGNRSDNSRTKDYTGKDSIGKDSIDKNNKDNTRVPPPTVEEVRSYISEQGYHIDAQAFVDFYQSKGWKVGNNHMKDWKACVRTWERRETVKPQKNNSFNQFKKTEYDYAELERKLIKN